MKLRLNVIFLCVVGLLVAATGMSINGQARPVPAPAAAGGIEQSRRLLDQYCVTSHNERTTNLSLQNLDLAQIADHAEVWERSSVSCARA